MAIFSIPAHWIQDATTVLHQGFWRKISKHIASVPTQYFPNSVSQNVESYSCQLLLCLCSYFCTAGANVEFESDVHWWFQSCHLCGILVLQGNGFATMGLSSGVRVSTVSQGKETLIHLWNEAWFFCRFAFAFLAFTHHPPEEWELVALSPPIILLITSL